MSRPNVFYGLARIKMVLAGCPKEEVSGYTKAFAEDYMKGHTTVLCGVSDSDANKAFVKAFSKFRQLIIQFNNL